MSIPGLGRLLGELNRRRVFRVGVGYAVFAAALIQLADVIVPRLGGTDHAVALLIRIALIGLPIVLILAWIFDITETGVRKTASQPHLDPLLEAPAKVFGTRKALLLTTAGLVLMATLVGGSVLVTRSRGAAFDETRVAVLPFSVLGNAGIKYLDEALVDLMSIKLNGAGDLVAVDPKPLIGFVRRSDRDADDDVALGRRVARQFRSGLFVSGVVVQTGTRLQLIASLYDHNGRTLINRATATCTEEELSAGLDDLARQLLHGTPASRAGGTTRLAALTTDSLNALKAYLRGQLHMRAANADSAIAELSKAVAIDTTFALAYLRLATAQSWKPRNSPEFAKTAETLRHLVVHLDRLSSRDRMLAETAVYALMGEGRRGVASASSILETQPDNVDAIYFLGEAQYHNTMELGQPLANARAAFAKVLTLDPTYGYALEHLADIALVEGDTIALDTLLTKLEQHLPTQGPAFRVLYALRKRPGEAVRSLPHAMAAMSDDQVSNLASRAVAIVPSIETLHGVAATMLQPHRSANTQRRGEVLLVTGDIMRGRVNRAIDQIKHQIAIDSASAGQWAALALALMVQYPHTRPQLQEYFLGWLAARPQGNPYFAALIAMHVGDTARFESSISQIEAARDTAPGILALTDVSPAVAAQRVSFVLRGQRDLIAGKCDVVLRRLKEPIITGRYETWVQTECLRAAQRDQEALLRYEQFPYMYSWNTTELTMLPLTVLYMAEIHDRAGRDRLAIAQYSRFLSLWEGSADAVFQPQVARARARLNALIARRG